MSNPIDTVMVAYQWSFLTLAQVRKIKERQRMEQNISPEKTDDIVAEVVAEKTTTQEPVAEVEPVAEETTDESVLSLEELQAEYTKKHWVPVPARYKNDKEWIKSKLV